MRGSAAAAAPVHVLLDPALPVEVADRVRPLLAGAGLEIRATPPARLMLSRLPHGNEAPLRAVLFDGRLGADVLPQLERPGPVLLLAAREEGTPSAWELQLLAEMLGDAPLLVRREGVRGLEVAAVSGLRTAAAMAEKVAREHGAANTAALRAADVSHELAANALLDAPVGPDGKPRYAFHRSGGPIALEDACHVRFAHDSGRLLICAQDRFGRLRRGPLLNAVRKLWTPARVEASGGGAGLGLLRCLQSADLVAARVDAHRRTEVLCAVDLGPGRRRTEAPKSVLLVGVEP